MTSLKDCRDIVRSVNDMYGNKRGCTSVAITIIRMVRERHHGETDYSDGMQYISENQVIDYAVQLFYYLTGVSGSRPTWTTFPRESWLSVDGANPRLTSECYRLAAWAVHNEDPTIGGGTSE